ncbi:hypothetical protein GBAR_LOCUS14862, partial [Geodia barretti]
LLEHFPRAVCAGKTPFGPFCKLQFSLFSHCFRANSTGNAMGRHELLQDKSIHVQDKQYVWGRLNVAV